MDDNRTRSGRPGVTECDARGAAGRGMIVGTSGMFRRGRADFPSVLPLRAGWRRLGDDEGSATAEYAIATMAAVGFAGLLVVILKGDEVRGILTDLVTRALTAAG
nr:DUF4244 domain-containing protein [Rathayibacter toxicus]